LGREGLLFELGRGVLVLGVETPPLGREESPTGRGVPPLEVAAPPLDEGTEETSWEEGVATSPPSLTSTDV
jgi:hypothetical protein